MGSASRAVVLISVSTREPSSPVRPWSIAASRSCAPMEGEHAHGGKPDGTDRSAGERDDQTAVPGQRGRPRHGGAPRARAPCAPTGRRARTSPSRPAFVMQKYGVCLPPKPRK